MYASPLDFRAGTQGSLDTQSRLTASHRLATLGLWTPWPGLWGQGTAGSGRAQGSHQALPQEPLGQVAGFSPCVLWQPSSSGKETPTCGDPAGTWPALLRS